MVLQHLLDHIDWTYPSPDDAPGSYYGPILCVTNGENHYCPQRPPATPATTIICLEFSKPMAPRDSDVWEETHFKLTQQESYRDILWGHDLSRPEYVSIFMQWEEAAPQQGSRALTSLLDCFNPISSMLRDRPQVYSLYLHWSSRDYKPEQTPAMVTELMVLRGAGDTLDSSILYNTDAITEIERHQNTCGDYIPYPDIPWVAQGWVLDHVPTSEKVQIVMWCWKDAETQERFKDPRQESDGDNDCYDTAVAHHLRRFEDAGAKIEALNMKLQRPKTLTKRSSEKAPVQRGKSLCGCVTQ